MTEGSRRMDEADPSGSEDQMKLYEDVTLRVAIPDHGLSAGDTGTLLEILQNGYLLIEFDANDIDDFPVVAVPASEVVVASPKEVVTRPEVLDMDENALEVRMDLALSQLPNMIRQGVFCSSRWDTMEYWEQDDACQDWQDVVAILEDAMEMNQQGRLGPDQREKFDVVLATIESSRPDLRLPEFDLPRIDISNHLATDA